MKDFRRILSKVESAVQCLHWLLAWNIYFIFFPLISSWEYSWELEKYLFLHIFDNNIYDKNIFIGKDFGQKYLSKNIFGKNIFFQNIIFQHLPPSDCLTQITPPLLSSSSVIFEVWVWHNKRNEGLTDRTEHTIAMIVPFIVLDNKDKIPISSQHF